MKLGSRTIASAEDMDTFAHAFESHLLPKWDRTHHAHLAVGLWYFANYPESEVLDRLRAAIRSYNVAQGGENTTTAGYHETITRIYVWYIGEHVRSHGDRPFMEQLHLLLNSPAADRAFPLRFYSRDRLFSIEARLGWVEPDLQPLATKIQPGPDQNGAG